MNEWNVWEWVEEYWNYIYNENSRRVWGTLVSHMRDVKNEREGVEIKMEKMTWKTEAVNIGDDYLHIKLGLMCRFLARVRQKG